MNVALCFSSDSTRSSRGVDSVAIAVDMMMVNGTMKWWTYTEARDRILKSRHVGFVPDYDVKARPIHLKYPGYDPLHNSTPPM